MFDANNNCELKRVNTLSDDYHHDAAGQQSSSTINKSNIAINDNNNAVDKHIVLPSEPVSELHERSRHHESHTDNNHSYNAQQPDQQHHTSRQEQKQINNLTLSMPTNHTNMPAVEVIRVAFKYQQSEVLQNINITVPAGQIYALLGPSGSGKTTLLRLILGRIKPKSGSIYVFGNSRPGTFNRHIGYMPQDKALSPELTIGETIDYFASLYGISARRLQQQKAELRKVLQLSPDDQVVSTLSGGQQKALSLALVFLHSPRLVILDEPTVGTDPLLGDQIWDYLRSSCKQGLSVIIVTHYIQEAALAQSVGMMRNGRIIEEGTPESLYCKYNEHDLEKIFIKICTDRTLLQQQAQAQQLKGAEALQQNICNFLSYDTKPGLVNNNNNNNNNNNITHDNNNNNNTASDKISYTKTFLRDSFQLDNGQRSNKTKFAFLWLLFILVRRNMQKFLSSKLLAILMLSPVYCTLLMCIVFKVDKVLLPVAIYDEHFPGPGQHSQRFLQIAKNFSVYHFDYRRVHSIDEALRSVESGDCLAAFWFDKNFTESLEIRALASTAQQEHHKKKPSMSGYEIETTTITSLPADSGPNNGQTDTAGSGNGNTDNESSTSSENNQMTTSEKSAIGDASTTESIVATASTDDDETTESISLSADNDDQLTTEANEDVSAARNRRDSDDDSDKTETTTTAQVRPDSVTEKDTAESDNEEEAADEEEEENDNIDEPEHGLISNATLRSSSIHIAIDHSNAILSKPAFDLFQYSTWNLFNEVIESHDRYPLANPVIVREIIYAEGTDAPDFLLSGYMIGFLYLSQVTLTAQLLIQERKDGFFDRAIVAGAKHSLMFFSHFITNMIFALMQTLLMSLIGFAWYKIPNFGSYYLVFLLVMLQSASSIMTGLFISSICRESFSAFFIALSITLSQLFTSGAVFPIISFDPLLKFLMNISPIAMPVESLRNVMLRGWDLSYFHVYHGFTTNVVTTLLFGTLALVFFTRSS